MSESQGSREQTHTSARQPGLGLVIGLVAVLILAWLITLVVWWLSDLYNWLTAAPLVMTIGTVTLVVGVLTVPVPRRRPG
jgi:Flp pilus assembly protein TadB